MASLATLSCQSLFVKTPCVCWEGFLWWCSCTALRGLSCSVAVHVSTRRHHAAAWGRGGPTACQQQPGFLGDGLEDGRGKCCFQWSCRRGPKLQHHPHEVFLLERSFAGICGDTGAMDVAHLPHKGHCCASVIRQRKVLHSPWNSCRCPLVKHVLHFPKFLNCSNQM